jgi:membrane protein YdbS with pleckstrin-like domain
MNREDPWQSRRIERRRTRLTTAAFVVVVAFIAFVAGLAAAAQNLWAAGCLLATIAALVIGVVTAAFEGPS